MLVVMLNFGHCTTSIQFGANELKCLIWVSVFSSGAACFLELCLTLETCLWCCPSMLFGVQLEFCHWHSTSSVKKPVFEGRISVKWKWFFTQEIKLFYHIQKSMRNISFKCDFKACEKSFQEHSGVIV